MLSTNFSWSNWWMKLLKIWNNSSFQPARNLDMVNTAKSASVLFRILSHVILRPENVNVSRDTKGIHAVVAKEDIAVTWQKPRVPLLAGTVCACANHNLPIRIQQDALVCCEFCVCFFLTENFKIICFFNRKKEEIWLSPMTKAPTLTGKSKTPPKTSITQRLQTIDIRRSVGVTAATPLVWLNRFTSAQPSH